MKAGLGMFAKAVGCGTVAGAAPFMVFLTLPMAFSIANDVDPLGALILIFYPILISAAVVLGAAVLIGLPVTAVLHQSAREHQRNYTVAGLATGALLPGMILLPFGGGIELSLVLVIPGMIAGTVTGLVWGKWREALAAEAANNLAED